jgi:hypothetical protein
MSAPDFGGVELKANAAIGRLFGRRCVVTVQSAFIKDYEVPRNKTIVGHQDGIEINGGDSQGMRVRFKTMKTLEKEPNNGEIVITNLALATRNALTAMGKGARIEVKAGYESTGVFRLIQGDIRFIDHKRNGSDWETTIKCADGERAYRFARLSSSYAANTPVSAVVGNLIDAMQLQLGTPDVRGVLSRKVFHHGYVVHGNAARALDRLLKSMRYEWRIEDGAVFILAKDDKLPEEPIAEISSTTGLIGSPEMGTPDTSGQPGMLEFKSLLVPARPGRQVKLFSERYKGFIDVIRVETNGDTHANDWYTSIRGRISGGAKSTPPTEVDIYISVLVKIDGTFQGGVQDTIMASVQTFIAGERVDGEIIRMRLRASGLPGLLDAKVLVGRLGPSKKVPPVQASVAIASTEIAAFDATQINVNTTTNDV